MSDKAWAAFFHEDIADRPRRELQGLGEENGCKNYLTELGAERDALAHEVADLKEFLAES